MLAKAVSRESGANFISVKGPEVSGIRANIVSLKRHNPFIMSFPPTLTPFIIPST